MLEIVNELGNMQHTLSQSYTELQQRHTHEMNARYKTQKRHVQEIVAQRKSKNDMKQRWLHLHC
jgi:hypothetical protein